MLSLLGCSENPPISCNAYGRLKVRAFMWIGVYVDGRVRGWAHNLG